MSRVAKGLFWSFFDYASVQIIQFIISVLIARLVAPTAFGIVVLTQVFISFAQLFVDGGFKTALIQRKNRTEVDYCTVFWFNLIVALLLYGLIFICAPLIANFYSELILIKLTRIIALNLIFSSLSVVQLAYLQINLDFKTQAIARIVSVFISGSIAVISAYRGLEIWALVIQSVLGSLCFSACLMLFSKWKPRILFSMSSFKEMFKYGVNVLFGNFLTTCYVQITNLIIGKVYKPVDLAYYNRGFSLGSLPAVAITGVVSNVSFSEFCKVQSNLQNLVVTYKKFLRISYAVVFPVLLLLCVFAQPIIDFLLTERWREAVPYLRIFCVAFLPYSFVEMGGKLVLAVGRSDLIAKVSLIKRSIAFIFLLIAIFINVYAVAWGLLISNWIELIISLYCVKLVIGLPILRQLRYVVDLFIAALLSVLVAMIVCFFLENVFLQCLVGICIACLMYVICMFVFRIEERAYICDFFKKIMNRSKFVRK